MPSTGQTGCAFNLFLEMGGLTSLQGAGEARAQAPMWLYFRLGYIPQLYSSKQNFFAQALSS